MKVSKVRNNIVIELENKDESEFMDKYLGSTVANDGSIAKGTFELRLSDDCLSHYIILKPEQKVVNHGPVE